MSRKDSGGLLVAYFSRTGNTEAVARIIHEKVGGNIFRMVPANPYPYDYGECVKQAREELERDFRPALALMLENPQSFDVIFLGYPIW
ncbi:Flavodoxin [Thermodesulforhabdus norvegica]|uniref:Flavodoxin n=1 Tax=Thermodesulforhabdus norvegica TaxID=39841 RepID=A0A1I4S6N9_9BACT|nr:Flavodoxin [Thermodesulforhabdus norvegica]